mmetsp:Transcript_10544/g.18650  ORF Transcript_10544/g.18650 Transcript_10544/m.18650 type:complete len:221 (-) Transcript_10544:7545-8207(-)
MRATPTWRGACLGTRGLSHHGGPWASTSDLMSATATPMGATRGRRASSPRPTMMTTGTTMARPLVRRVSTPRRMASRARMGGHAPRPPTALGRAAMTTTTATGMAVAPGSRASSPPRPTRMARPRWRWQSCCQRATMGTTGTQTTGSWVTPCSAPQSDPSWLVSAARCGSSRRLKTMMTAPAPTRTGLPSPRRPPPDRSLRAPRPSAPRSPFPRGHPSRT